MGNIPFRKLAAAVHIHSDNTKGSGLLFCKESIIYLVTARHVLYKKTESGNFELYTNLITINCPTTDIDDDNLKRIEVNLVNSENAFYNPSYDVCIVKLGTYTLTNGNKTLVPDYSDKVNAYEEPEKKSLISGTEAVREMNDVTVTNDVFLLGFPTSLGLNNYTDYFNTNKPIVRKGIISYVNKDKFLIIIDCPVYSGNSGGPVIEVTENDGKKDYSIIGIVSEYIPYKQEWFNYREKYSTVEYVNSGYAAIVAFDKVNETIEMYKK